MNFLHDRLSINILRHMSVQTHPHDHQQIVAGDWWLVAGAVVLEAFGFTLVALWRSFEPFGLSLWRSLGGSWEPLFSHWMPLGDFRELSSYFWSSWAPLLEALGAPWAHCEVTWCYFGCLGHLKWGLREIWLT